MSDEIRIGDVVTLRSGGRTMTVGGVAGADHIPEGQVRVAWFETSELWREHLEIRLFPVAMLEVVRPVYVAPPAQPEVVNTSDGVTVSDPESRP